MSAIKWIKELQEPFRPKTIANHPHYTKIQCLRRTTNYRYHTSPKTLTRRSHLSAVLQKGATAVLAWGSLTPPHHPTGKTEETADLQPSLKRRRISGGRRWTIWSTCLTANLRAKRSNRAVNWNLQRKSYEKSEKAFSMGSITSSLIRHSRAVADFRTTNWLPLNSWTNSNSESKESGTSNVFLRLQIKGNNT